MSSKNVTNHRRAVFNLQRVARSGPVTWRRELGWRDKYGCNFHRNSIAAMENRGLVRRVIVDDDTARLSITTEGLLALGAAYAAG